MSARKLAPRDAQAASTSGLAGRRYIFSLRREPLNRVKEYDRGTSSRMGAVKD
jgi:hypothetical protein